MVLKKVIKLKKVVGENKKEIVKHQWKVINNKEIGQLNLKDFGKLPMVLLNSRDMQIEKRDLNQLKKEIKMKSSEGIWTSPWKAQLLMLSAVTVLSWEELVQSLQWLVMKY